MYKEYIFTIFRAFLRIKKSNKIFYNKMVDIATSLVEMIETDNVLSLSSVLNDETAVNYKHSSYNFNGGKTFDIPSLSIAILNKARAISDLLISKGADPNLGDRYRRTPVFYACFCGDSSSLKQMLERNSKLFGYYSTGDYLGGPAMHPLFAAVNNAHYECVEILLNNGVDVNTRDGNGMTGLMKSAMNGYAELMNLFIQKGADLSMTDNSGRNFLHYVAWFGKVNAPNLMAHRPVYDAQDDLGMTPLHIACLHKRKDLIKSFVLGGSDLTKEDNDGRTAEQISIQAKHTSANVIFQEHRSNSTTASTGEPIIAMDYHSQLEMMKKYATDLKQRSFEHLSIIKELEKAVLSYGKELMDARNSYDEINHTYEKLKLEVNRACLVCMKRPSKHMCAACNSCFCDACLHALGWKCNVCSTANNCAFV